MGNTPSIDADDNLSLLEQQPLQEAAADENLLDFSPLFVIGSLHKALLNVKEPPGSPLMVYKEQLVKWLGDKVDKSETTVSMAEFVDFLSGKGSSKEEAMSSFEELDTDGEGSVDVTYCLSVLKSTTTRLQELLPCQHLPSLIDVYSPEKTESAELPKALLRYLLRYRVSSDKLVLPALGQINDTLQQRAKLVAGRYFLMEEKEKDEELLGTDGADDDGSERMIISKCYSKIAVSTGDKKIENMFDNNMETYWQSNGSPRSHWVRIHLLPGVMVKELAVSVKSSDDSYMPKIFNISVGNSESSLKEIKVVNIPRHTTGRYLLIRNLNANYKYVQLNIKGCHSDGCDCRIRGLHIKGCKYKKEVEPTVMDTMAIWYLNIIASTAKAAMPLSPHLRDTIISQSKTSLKSLRPLSLSPSSPNKPDFFSTFVISEMDKFLVSLCLPEETFVSVDADPLHVLLSFALAHGNVNTILDTLQILLDNLSLEFSLFPLLKRMEEMKDEKKQRHAGLLKLELVSCDGGKKDDDHAPDVMLINLLEQTADPYVSETGKKIVNVVLKDESLSLLQLSNVKVKVQSGDQGARAGLVFVLTSDPKDLDELVKQTDKFNEWTKEDYHKMRSENSEPTDDLCPVAYFEPDKDSHVAEFAPDVTKTGQYVVFKFFGSLKEDVERVGVHSLRLYGLRTSSEGLSTDKFLEKLDTMAPLPSDTSECVQGGVVLIRVLGFLATMLKDLNKIHLRRKAVALDPSAVAEEHLAVEGLSLEKIWNLYIPLTLNPDSKMDYASVLCLHLLRAALPFIKPTQPTNSKTDSPNKAHPSLTSDPTSTPSEVLSHLCGILDSSDTDPIVRGAAQDIIVEGVVIFFPDANARKEYLLNMIGAVLEENQPKSWWLKFEALCHYFSKTDSNSVLNLPKTLDETTEVDTGPAYSILTTMLAVATKEGLNIIQTGANKPDDLVKLLSALQASMFFWCKRVLCSSDKVENIKKAASSLLSDYVGKLVDYCVVLLKELEKKEEIIESLPESLTKSLLGRALPEMIVCLNTIVDSDIRPVDITNKLHPLVPTFSAVLAKAPTLFLKVDSKEVNTSSEVESVVGVWTRESPHNYENNADTNEEFVCSSANRFSVEFDPRCHTERRYDYLEFTDAVGVKTKFDSEYGTSRWLKKIEFKGQRLKFHFHSDSSNNEWGYKFTIKAYGTTPPSLSWLFDLQISLLSLLGLLASSTLGKKRAHRPIKSSEKSDQEKEEETLIDSDLWKTLFRGGYMVGKLTRSLSGAYAASPADSALSAVLQDLANGPEGVGLQLLELCRAETKGHFYGGPLVDRAVNSVFAALIWHSQDIREELLPLVSSESVPKVTPGVLTAFKSAEAMRRELVEARQKVVQSNEEETEDKEKDKEKIDEDAPVVACHEKAVFLLKFSGLSRVKDIPSNCATRPQWAKKSVKWQKVTNAVSTVGVLKQHLHESTDRAKVSDKYPSFELVLNFVKNESLSVEKVHTLLQQRSKFASAVAQTYTFAAEVVRVMGVDSLFELPGLAFLQQLLARQNFFPKHYATKLDGCGLDLENQVRKSYRLLLTMLVETINSFKSPPSREHSFSRSLVLLFLSHLLDFEWQEYDHALLSELQLPEFLFSSAINCSVTEDREKMDKFENEEDMLKRYEIHMKLLKMFNELQDRQTWKALLEMPFGVENAKETHLFLVAISYSRSEKVTIQCDNCSSTIHGRWYRDMDEEEEDDFDLCTSCFDDGTGKEHNAEHTFMSIGQYGCDDCGLAIMGHRFHSNTRDDFDLCLGCFRKEQDSGRTDSWTVYFSTEISATEKKNKYLSSDAVDTTGHQYQDGYILKSSPSSQLRTYVLQHCWMLFSSMCLAMAKTVNNSKPAIEVEYLHQACNIKLECLKHLNFSLRAAVLDKIEKAAKKKVIESHKKEEEKKEESEDKPNEDKPTDQSEQSSSSVDVETDGEITAATKATPSSTEATPTPVETTPTEEDKEQEEDSLIAVASKKPRDVDSRIGFFEKTFVASYIDNILGLLTAVLPKELNLSVWIQHKPDIEVFLAEELLPSLLQLSSCSEVDAPIRFKTLLIATQYFARLNPQVADRAIEIARGQQPGDDCFDAKSSGLKTVQFLFECGATSLKRSNFSCASTAESCLLLLSRPLQWRSALSTTIGQCLKTNLEDMDLGSVFGLLVLAGFPRVPRAGSILTYSGSEDKPSPVVLLKVEDNGKGSAVNVKTRENVYVKLSDYEIEDSLSGCIDPSKLQSILPLIRAAVKPVKQDAERSVETTWILGLALKALHLLLQSPESEGVVNTLLDAGLVPAVVKLASRPTNFSQKWRLAELEVLGISMYQPASATEETDSGEAEDKEDKDDKTAKDKIAEDKTAEDKTTEDKEKQEASPSAAEPEESTADKNAKILEGLPEEAQGILQTLSEVFMCKMSVLRAMIDSVDGDMERFMGITENSYKDGVFNPSEEILEAAKKWESEETSSKPGTQEVQQNLEDVGVTRLVPVEIDIRSIEATAEDSNIFKKTKNLLKSDSKDDQDTKNSPVSRQESYSLLKDELSSLKNKPPTRDTMFKTFQAIAVLQARRVLASLLVKWPKTGVRLSTTTLGCVDMPQYFCLLDLLVKQEGDEILTSVLECAEPTELVSLVVTAVQCMSDVSVGKETREIKYKQDKQEIMTEKGKIVIPHAASLTISFHPVNKSIKFSSSEDLSDHSKHFTSTAFDPEDIHSHVIPGDTVYYEVEMVAPDNKNSVCSFSVNGTQTGRFETGHYILHHLLCDDLSSKFISCLPLSRLWTLLIAVACKYTGSERLKVVKLLMKLVSLQGNREEGDVVSKDRLELSALKPLWQLYTTLIKNYEDKTKSQQILAPEIIRVFTELFLCVENLAEDWGISQDLMIRTTTKEELHKWLEKGISNVAYVSLGLGLENLASTAFIQAKRDYVPPPPPKKKKEDQPDDGGDETQSEPTDSFDDTTDDDDDDDDDSSSDDSYES